MKKKYKYICLAAVALVILMAGIITVLRPVPVQGYTVEAGSLVKEFTARAAVLPEHSMVLNAPAAGTVSELPYEAGSRVEQGACLLRTDSAAQIGLDLQQEQLSQQLLTVRREYDRLYGENGAAASELEAASSQYETAKRSYDSAKALADQGYMAQQELQELGTQMELACQKRVQAEKNASEQQKALSREQIQSLERQLAASREAAGPGMVVMPYDGVLWEVYVKQGEYLNQNQQTLLVYDETQMKLEASVLSGDSAGLEPGMEASVIFGDRTTQRAKVRFVARTAAQELSSTGLEENRCAVVLDCASIPPWTGAGQEADVEFSVTVADHVLAVPASAIVPDGEGSRVYLIQSGKARGVPVETGRREGGMVEILSGLSQGDMVAADPYGDSVEEGRRVSPLHNPGLL